jgi:hypothetical protein
VKVTFASFKPPFFGKPERGFAKVLRLETQKGLRRAGKKGVTNLRQRSARIKDTGAFKKGWRARAVFTRLEFWNAVMHAQYVEGGRRAGAAMPPVSVIEAWALRKIGIPGLGFVIARNIARNGIRPRPVLKRDDTQARLAGIVAKELTAAWDVAQKAWRDAK